MILLIFNIVVALIVAAFDVKYLYSFEISFICSLFIFISSFKAVQKKVNAMVEVSKIDLKNDEELDISKKERFFIGSRISFGFFRIFSYIILGLCVVGLVNNQLFFIIPFILGTFVSSFGLAIVLLKKRYLSFKDR